MWHARLSAAALGAVAMIGTSQIGLAADQLKLAVGGRGVGETFVTEIGDKAGLFKKQNLELDLFYTDGGGETQRRSESHRAFSAPSACSPKGRRCASSAVPTRAAARRCSGSYARTLP
jgi:hypothetical protein